MALSTLEFYLRIRSEGKAVSTLQFSVLSPQLLLKGPWNYATALQ